VTAWCGAHAEQIMHDGNFVSIHVMKGAEYSSVILNLCTRWRWAISFTPRPLNLRKNPRQQRDGWVGTRAVLAGFQEGNIFLSCRTRTPDRPTRSQSLYRPRYPALQLKDEQFLFHCVFWGGTKTSLRNKINYNISIGLGHAQRNVKDKWKRPLLEGSDNQPLTKMQLYNRTEGGITRRSVGRAKVDLTNATS